MMMLRERVKQWHVLHRWLGLQGRHNSQVSPPFKGKRHSDEYKHMMSEKHSGSANPFFDRSHSIAHQERLRQLSMERRGPLSPTWRGGKGSSYGSGWTGQLRNRVRERDGKRCRSCGKPQNERFKLDVHHLDETKSKHDVSNLVSLCRSCHLGITYGSLRIAIQN